MKKICRKRLNNKGFTLVELLAVVIILAVVMGIAMNSVLSSMNKARGGSLADTAMVIANSFNQKYTESLVDGVPSNVYGDVLNAKGYNFQSSIIYYIDARLADTFNISTNGYVLKQSTNATNFPTAITSAKNTGIKESFVSFDANTGKFVVCMFANKTGSYFVDAYKTKKAEDGKLPSIDLGVNGSVEAAEGEMYACSNGTKSW